MPDATSDARRRASCALSRSCPAVCPAGSRLLVCSRSYTEPPGRNSATMHKFGGSQHTPTKRSTCGWHICASAGRHAVRPRLSHDNEAAARPGAMRGLATRLVQDVALLDVVLISARRRHLLYAHNLDGHQLRSKALAVSVAAVGLAGALAARGNARRVGGSRGATASATGASFAPFEAPAAGLRLCRRDSVPAGERAAGRAGRARGRAVQSDQKGYGAVPAQARTSLLYLPTYTMALLPADTTLPMKSLDLRPGRGGQNGALAAACRGKPYHEPAQSLAAGAPV